MSPTEERFRAKVRQQGNHEVWSGARDTRGTGLVRIDGSLRTVQRAAWEFANGPLPQGVRVLSETKRRRIQERQSAVPDLVVSWRFAVVG